MKRILAILLLICLVSVCGCAMQADQTLDVIGTDEYRLQAVNDTGVDIRGFGYEWYQDGELLLTGQCTAHDGGFLTPDDLLLQTFRLEELRGEGDYTLRIYVLDYDSAVYCETPCELHLIGGMLIRLSITGRKDAYSVEFST